MMPVFVFSQTNIQPMSKCLIYGENQFSVSGNTENQFFIKFGEREFPMRKAENTANLIATIDPEEFPVIRDDNLVVGQIFIKTIEGSKTFSKDVYFSAVKKTNWEIIEKNWDETPIYFQNGKIGIQPRRAEHKGNAADNTAHCLESVTFVDPNGDFETLKMNDSGLKKLGKYGIVNLTFSRKNLNFGKGKLIVKHLGNPASQEIPVVYYQSHPEKVEVDLRFDDRNGSIKMDKPQLIESPGESYLTYCPKGYFNEKTKNNLRWDMGLNVCKERPIRINGDKKRFTDYTQTVEMIENSDPTMVLNLKLTDGRIYKYLFTLKS